MFSIRFSILRQAQDEGYEEPDRPRIMAREAQQPGRLQPSFARTSASSSARNSGVTVGRVPNHRAKPGTA